MRSWGGMVAVRGALEITNAGFEFIDDTEVIGVAHDASLCLIRAPHEV